MELHIPDESTHLYVAHWAHRMAQLAAHRCTCGNSLRPEQVADRALCDACTERDAARVRRLNADGLVGSPGG